jgi:hypothetical protein
MKSKLRFNFSQFKIPYGRYIIALLLALVFFYDWETGTAEGWGYDKVSTMVDAFVDPALTFPQQSRFQWRAWHGQSGQLAAEASRLAALLFYIDHGPEDLFHALVTFLAPVLMWDGLRKILRPSKVSTRAFIGLYLIVLTGASYYLFLWNIYQAPGFGK